MNFGNDPLLQQRNYTLPELEKEQEALQQKMVELKRNYQGTQQSSSPTWDEIERITSSLSNKEFEYLQKNEEFQESSMIIQQILQREYMRIMRPVVENTKDGKDALDKHLTLLKRIQKSAKEEAEKKDALINEYITQYSHLTWQEFIDAKSGKQPKQAKK
jgi:hypothetical protein|nr:MAG TPA: hypothetical protein [Caudoviricetes sp.]